jgi:hypothetical protein
MKPIEVIGHIDEQHHLHAVVPASLAPGQVKVLVLVADDNEYQWPTPDLTEDEWREFVAHGLRQELGDPREDLYGGEDGAPANEAR